jgi:hypothetical protein
MWFQGTEQGLCRYLCLRGRKVDVGAVWKTFSRRRGLAMALGFAIYGIYGAWTSTRTPSPLQQLMTTQEWVMLTSENSVQYRIDPICESQPILSVGHHSNSIQSIPHIIFPSFSYHFPIIFLSFPIFFNRSSFYPHLLADAGARLVRSIGDRGHRRLELVPFIGPQRGLPAPRSPRPNESFVFCVIWLDMFVSALGACCLIILVAPQLVALESLEKDLADDSSEDWTWQNYGV